MSLVRFIASLNEDKLTSVSPYSRIGLESKNVCQLYLHSVCGVMLIHSEALISLDEVKLSFGALILVSPPTPAQYLICPRCGSRTPVTFNYCSFCGCMLHPERVWAYASKICKKCKKRIPMSAHFCPECGRKQ